MNQPDLLSRSHLFLEHQPASCTRVYSGTEVSTHPAALAIGGPSRHPDGPPPAHMTAPPVLYVCDYAPCRGCITYRAWAWFWMLLPRPERPVRHVRGVLARVPHLVAVGFKKIPPPPKKSPALARPGNARHDVPVPRCRAPWRTSQPRAVRCGRSTSAAQHSDSSAAQPSDSARTPCQ